MYIRITSATCGRPSVGITRVSCSRSCAIATMPGAWTIRCGAPSCVGSIVPGTPKLMHRYQRFKLAGSFGRLDQARFVRRASSFALGRQRRHAAGGRVRDEPWSTRVQVETIDGGQPSKRIVALECRARCSFDRRARTRRAPPARCRSRVGPRTRAGSFQRDVELVDVRVDTLQVGVAPGRTRHDPGRRDFGGRLRNGDRRRQRDDDSDPEEAPVSRLAMSMPAPNIARFLDCGVRGA